MESSFFCTRLLNPHRAPRFLGTSIAQRASGFSLVEMMVVLAIISVVTSIALLGQGEFNRSILLTDTAYTVALSLREMQTYGLSSRKFNATQNAGYGAYVTSATTGSYVLFADTADADTVDRNTYATSCLFGGTGTPESKPGDCIYTPGSDGIVQTYAFSRGFRISSFCGKNGAAKYCSTDGTTPLTEMNIVFLRSNTETAVLAKRNGVWTPLTSAELYLQSYDGSGTKGICVSRVGQISVTNGTCL
jgi:prepilin-type N-terminal cleavage/methylation domain-containing protein